ncbi:MAG: hypothetical protein C3F13_09220 [Anaerolineales bacterium]|nr:terpene cyclase/mutase family protein [Anaerolineae bacterium]PWB53578.1 MAG: hypothetical protein C3F13_09220 [Anaerolineales bacterium]
MKKFLKLSLSLIAGFLLVAGVICLVQVKLGFAQVAPSQTDVIQAGLTYLQSQQQSDGGITGFSEVSDPDTTARSVMAFIAARQTLTDVLSTDSLSMLDYLANQAISYTHDITGSLFPGRAGVLLTAVSLAGGDPSDFGGMDLAGELEANYHSDAGTYSTDAKGGFSSGEASDLSQAWSILGLSLAGRTTPATATDYLIRSQAVDGSWGAGDPDTTALAVTALLASRNLDSQADAIQKAIAYFHASQAPSGGWKPAWDTDPLNADSTGWIIQALVTAGEDVRGQSWSMQQANPLDALLSLHKPDGSIGGSYANTYSTAEAIIGLSGIPLSNLVAAPVPHRAGLVIYYSDSSLYTTCISFTETTITGLDLLIRSGLPVETATNPNQGTAVCKIGEVGNASSDCFGSMPDYWSYWQLATNGWDYAVSGADQSQVQDGAINAWSWGTGNPPPVLTFQNICEGVPYVLPPSTQTVVPATDTSEPQMNVTEALATLTPVATEAPPPSPAVPVNYIIYAVILLGLGLLILFLIRRGGK